VALQLHRFPGAETASVTSNAVPLPQGWALPGSIDSIRLLVGGVEVAAHVAGLFGKHADGTIRSVLLQTAITPALSAQGASLSIGAVRTKTRPALAALPAVNTVGVLLPGDVDYLISTQVVGPTVSRSQANLGPPSIRAYEAKYDQFQQYHWNIEGDAWSGNYYDRALAYFAFWVRTGNATYYERGARIAVNYRRTYLEANNYGATEWWTQLEGLAVHYWLTGDPRSREAVYKTAENLHRSRGGDRMANTQNHPWMDSRVQSKVLGGKVLAHQLDAPPFGAVQDWKLGARSDLDIVLSSQAADGAFRWSAICGQSSNFMTGMLLSVLVSYTATIEDDPTVETAVIRAASFLRDSQWLPTDKAFRYYSGTCATGGPYAAPDLNGFFLEPLGWLAYRTQDRRWIELADEVLEGAVERTFMNGSKQFNQAYKLSWRYLWYRELLQTWPDVRG
jgi:hypothetical protein